ncbi:hypothetical protein [Halorussus halobius]|uniref:hypothetical protein n=1 Tax=Halorussus halobius TaxID=1710537 RepID=UPI001092F853|nr:hypothetical protein [Halorussus halobius]
MPSRLTRRRVLGGLAGGSAAGFAGYRLLPPTLLPDPVLRLRTERRPVPEVDTALAVSPDALDDSREHLRDVIDRAESAWDAVEDADVETQNEEFDRGLESTLDTAREQLDAAEGADPTTDALRTLRFGVNRAAWSLGAARAIADDYTAEELNERSTALHDDANDFADRMGYGVADPRRGLAVLARTERALYFARMKAYGQVYVSGEAVAKEEYDYREAVEAIRGAIDGRRWLGDARAIYEAHRSNVDEASASEVADLEAHLDRTWRDLAARIDEEFPDRDAALDRYAERDDEGAQSRAVSELLHDGLYQAYDARPPTDGLRGGLLARAALEHAKALQHGRAFQSAIERLDAAFADDAVDATLAARTKREATGRLRELLADADDPLTRELAARPREEVVIGDWPYEWGSSGDHEYPNAEAYVMYLLGSEIARATPDVRDLLLP